MRRTDQMLLSKPVMRTSPMAHKGLERIAREVLEYGNEAELAI